MRIIFCNIAYMKNYKGSENDVPESGGSYVSEHADGGERWNFLEDNGKCYGYFMHDGEIHIERIDNTTPDGNIVVVWVAKPKGKNPVIVGWYQHAKVYRKMQTRCGNWEYNVEADAENCHLLPENERKFPIPRASKEGAGKGMGRSSIWYADSDYAKNKFVPEVIEYITEKLFREYCRTNQTEKAVETGQALEKCENFSKLPSGEKKVFYNIMLTACEALNLTDLADYYRNKI